MDDRYLHTTRGAEFAARARDLARRARRFVHERPLQVIALTVGVGFVVGKLVGLRQE